MSGEHARFGLNDARSIVHVPYPLPARDWTLRSLTCGVALQCSPSKDRIAQYPLHELSPRELVALTLVEGGVALGWVAARWPGLLPELRRLLPGLEIADGDLDAPGMLCRTDAVAQSGQELSSHPLLGALPLARPARRGFTAAVKRMYGRMPWTSPRTDSVRLMSIPVGGEGGVRNPNLPPPSRPEDEDIEIRPGPARGHPLPGVERLDPKLPCRPRRGSGAQTPSHSGPRVPVSTDLRRWFEEHTHRAMKSGLEDGSDLDVDRYVNHYIDLATGEAVRAAGVQRSAAQFPGRHHCAVTRRQFVAGNPRRSDLPVGVGLRRRALPSDDARPRTSRHFRVQRQHPPPRRGPLPEGL